MKEMKKVFFIFLFGMTIIMTNLFAYGSDKTIDMDVVSSDEEISSLINREWGTYEVINEDEDPLNVIRVNNDDGTKSVYIFDKNVKTVDEVGDVSYLSESQVATASAAIDSTNVGITEATVFSGTPSTNYSSLEYSAVGSFDSLGTALTLVRFDLSAIADIAYDDILSAKYCTDLIEQENECTVVEVYFLEAYWNPSNVTWNGKPSYYGTEKICTQNVYSQNALESVTGQPNYEQQFYITSAIQAWQQGMQNCGIMLKAREDEGWCKLRDNSDSSNPSYLTITYNEDEAGSKAIGVNSGKSYFLVNKNSKLAVSADSLISGVGVTQKTLESTTLQTWKLTYLSNGYYSIKCGNSTSCLTAEDDGILSSTYTGATSQQWQIARNWDGSYQIISRSTGNALAVSPTATETGTDVSLYTHYVDFYKYDDWTLLPAEKGTASLFGFSQDTLTYFETITYVNKAKTWIDACGYEDTVYEDVGADVGFARLQDSSIWHYSGHGNTSMLIFTDSNLNKSALFNGQTKVSNNQYGVMSLGQFALNKLQLCTLGACAAGMDSENGTSSLVGLLYQKGTHYCSSYTKSVLSGSNDDWYWYFYLMLNNYDVQYARNFADTFYYNNTSVGSKGGETNARHELGDSSIYINYDNSYLYTSTNLQEQTLELDNNSTVILSEEETSKSSSKSIVVNGKSCILQFLAESPVDEEGNCLDFYTDTYKGVYAFDNESNVLRYYLPCLALSKLGNTPINEEKAVKVAEDFITKLGYDVSKLTLLQSEDGMKEFVLKYLNDGEKVFEVKLMADSEENLYITCFRNYN